MDLPRSIALLPHAVAVLLLVVVPVAAVVAASILIRRRYPLEKLRPNNEVAGYKYAAIGAMYGILQAFVAVAAWEDYQDAREDVLREASALVILDELARELPQPKQDLFRHALVEYTLSVADVEWPLLERGERARDVVARHHRLFRIVVGMGLTDPAGAATQQAIFSELTSAGHLRRDRLNAAEVTIPGILWLALAVGAAVTIGFMFFFGAPSVAVQATQAALLATVILVVLLVTVAFAHPFSGPAAIPPDAFREAARAMREPD